MLLKPTVTRAAGTDPALDQAELYARGLDHVRRLSRRLWTDHNTHDPGITILELLCYALTDLGYRAQFPLEDLLATPADNAATMAGQFFTPRQVLPNRPLAARDYRKLIIDQAGVTNAWIIPAAQRYHADTAAARLRHDNPGGPGIRPVDLRGLYQVRVEYGDEVRTPQARKEVDARVMALLQANRNLCEDFVAVTGVEPQPYSLCAELELEPDADPSRIAAQLCFEVQRYLAPQVNHYTLSEMLARQHEDGSARTVAEIFDGPLLEHGFIDDEELAAADLRTEIRLSDIISVIMDIPGVRAVRDIVVNELRPNGKAIEPPDKWRLQVPAGKRPRLDEQRGRLVFYKGAMPVVADPVSVERHRRTLDEALRRRQEMPQAKDLPVPLGRPRDTARYHSFQHHFPQVYGLSAAGLPGDADPLRRAQALQLKGYLLFFDQVMANFFAQLAQVRDLFARDPAASTTYFAQVVESLPGHERIYPEGIDAAELASLLEDREAALARRNRFLDHLLARFAEDFHHYASIVYSAFGARPEDLIAAKCAFLNDYPTLGGGRGLARDYTRAAAEPWGDSSNVSGLERRLKRLLGIEEGPPLDLSALSVEIYCELDDTPGDEFRFRVKHPISGKILLSSSTRYVTPEQARAEMMQAIARAQHSEAYQRKTTADGRHYFNIVDASGEVIARRIEYFATPAARDAAIGALVAHLRGNASQEGMYLIENILLRPQQEGEPFLPICVEPGCSDCADADPYSYRLHIVLPAYAGRFRDMEFRRFVEETIRLEAPAHLLPKICWVDIVDMELLQQAYREWIPLQTDLANPQRKQKLEALLEVLCRVKNVYPPQKLHDCADADEAPRFILNRSALGSRN